MKIWLSTCDLDCYFEDSNVKFGIGWFRHHKNHKWFGFTFHIYLLYWLVSINYVDNYKEYDKKIHYKRTKKETSTK